MRRSLSSAPSFAAAPSRLLGSCCGLCSVVKTRMQSLEAKKLYRNSFHCTARIFSEVRRPNSLRLSVHAIDTTCTYRRASCSSGEGRHPVWDASWCARILQGAVSATLTLLAYCALPFQLSTPIVFTVYEKGTFSLLRTRSLRVCKLTALSDVAQSSPSWAPDRRSRRTCPLVGKIHLEHH